MATIFKITITGKSIVFHVDLDNHKQVHSVFSQMPAEVKDYIAKNRLLELASEIQKYLEQTIE
jgi:hypothetical protein